jgi:type IV pilus assembly protein PilA
MQRLARFDSQDDGFTLIELLVVIIIIGILAAIAIPVFLNQRKKGWDAQAKNDSRNLAAHEEAYIVDHDMYLDFDSRVGAPTVEEFAGYRDTDKVVTMARGHGASGYCIISKSRSGDYFVYDSDDGGLDHRPHAGVPVAFAPGSSCASGVPSIP